MLKMEEFLVIRDLHHKGLNISQIAQETGFNWRTIRRRLEAEVVAKRCLTGHALQKPGDRVNRLVHRGHPH